MLTEVLPYEVPPNFGNLNFARFLRKYDVRRSNDRLTWKSDDHEIELLVRLLMLIPPAELVEPDGILKTIKLSPLAYTIPLELEALRSNGEMRVLSVPHPAAQLRVVEYYEQHESAILDATSRSSFSLRRPAFVARFTNVGDRLHRKLVKSWEGTNVEEEGREYRALHSYFAYRRYSNVYKFYESREFQSLEQKYRSRAQVDVKQCFRSIYTHSVTWATHGKHLVKDHLKRVPAVKPKLQGVTFSEAFDVVMQKSNYNETNGILIGPEYSRIFAEIILQRVDVDLVSQLTKLGLAAGVNYDIRRYVDDYFIFAQRREDIEAIVLELRRCLAHFNLHLNDSKTESASHPSISPVSSAKSHLRARLGVAFARKRASRGKGSNEKYPGMVDVEALITDYKIVLTSTGAPASALANYALTASERTLVGLFRRYLKGPKGGGRQGRLASRLTSLMQFVWFVYSTSPMLSPTVKMLRIIDHIVVFLDRETVSSSIRNEILDSVADELKRHLLQPIASGRLNIEKIYLLQAAGRIGRLGLLEPEELCTLFCATRRVGRTLELDPDLDYFAIMALLSYCGRRRRYEPLRMAAEAAALKRFNSSLARSAERVFLGIDFLACPFVSVSAKDKMAKLLGIDGTGAKAAFYRGRHLTFHDWDRFDLGNALDMKRHLEVY